MDKTKFCYKCETPKSADSFAIASAKSDGRQSTCKACHKEYNALHRERRKVADRAYYLANLGKRIEYRARPEVKKKHSERNCLYAKVHSDKVNALVAKRKAARLQRTPKNLTRGDWTEIKWAYSYAQKLTIATGVKHEVDHIVPLQGKIVSGLHVPWNLQVIPAKINRSKGSKFG